MIFWVVLTSMVSAHLGRGAESVSKLGTPGWTMLPPVAVWSYEWWLADGTENLTSVPNDMGAGILQIPPELHIWQR